jgi:uncharacterized protein (TIGR02996 family)
MCVSGAMVSEQLAFIRAMWEHFDDDAPRLVYADWLEEHGDAVRAEFIRVQCELEPLRDRKGDERAVELRQREAQLLRRHRDQWLEPVRKKLAEQPFAPVFRRGMVESVVVSTEGFLRHDELIAATCPLLSRVTFIGCRDAGSRLARSVFLNCFPQIELADWITPQDARAIASSPNLEGSQSLVIWLGSASDQDICSMLSSPHVLPRLTDITLVQVRGGLSAGAYAEELAYQADGLADEINRKRGRQLARLARPFNRSVMLRGAIMEGLFAGHLPDRRPVLAAIGHDGWIQMAELDDTGRLLRRHLDALESFRGKAVEGDGLAALTHRTGFTSGEVRVGEFDTGRLSLRLLPLGFDPERPPPEWAWPRWDREQVCEMVARGGFLLSWDYDGYGDPWSQYVGVE